MCDQQSLRSACTYAQSDQSLCKSLEYSMSLKRLTEQHLEFLSLKGGCIRSSESTLVKMSHCWKSYVAAHIYYPGGPESSRNTQPNCWFSHVVVHKHVFSVYKQDGILSGLISYRNKTEF